jgi:hypothetical protein
MEKRKDQACGNSAVGIRPFDVFANQGAINCLLPFLQRVQTVTFTDQEIWRDQHFFSGTKRMRCVVREGS